MLKRPSTSKTMASSASSSTMRLKHAKQQRPSSAAQALKLLKRRHPKLLKRRSSSITSNGSPMSVMSSNAIFTQKKEIVRRQQYHKQKRNNYVVVNNNNNNNKENGKVFSNNKGNNRTDMNNKNNMIINNNDDNKSIVTNRQIPQVNNTIQNRSALSTISYPTTITNQKQTIPSSPPPPPPKRIPSYNNNNSASVVANGNLLEGINDNNNNYNCNNDNILQKQNVDENFDIINASMTRERAPTWEEEQAAVYMPSEQLVRVQCPHCSRKFAKEASKRHIEVCARIKNKPKAPPKQVAAFTDRLGVRRGGRGKLSCTFNEKTEIANLLGSSGTMIDNINVVKSSSSGSSSSNDGATTKKTAGTFLPKKKDTRERLSRLWGEIMFLLRKPIRNENDLNVTLERASRGFNFLNDLEKAASELNMLQGTLSRYLLPFNNKTSVADQAANNNNEFGSSELDGLLTYTLRRKLVRDATDLRSLIRVKIADDADLMQAKESLKHIMKFGRSLMRIAKNDQMQPYQLLKML